MTRPLHAVFTELLSDDAARQAYAADPSGFLDSAGHAGLPAELVDEAVISFTDAASPAVAEHLAPFVMSHGPVPDALGSGEGADPDGLDGLELLAGAPTGEDTRLDEPIEPLEPSVGTDTAGRAGAEPPADELDFGAGSHQMASGRAAEPAAEPDWGPTPPDDATAIPDPAPAESSLLGDPLGEPGDVDPADDLDAD